MLNFRKIYNPTQATLQFNRHCQIAETLPVTPVLTSDYTTDHVNYWQRLVNYLLSDGVNSKLVRLLIYWFRHHVGKANSELITEHIFCYGRHVCFNTLSFNLLNVWTAVLLSDSTLIFVNIIVLCRIRLMLEWVSMRPTLSGLSLLPSVGRHNEHQLLGE